MPQVTFYLHDSILNCLLWGLYGSGGLKTSANVAGDLLATLLPAVPKTYPHQELIIEIQALIAPKVNEESSHLPARILCV
jgi:hypothetical protein